ncbi:FGGY family carbohydrate kinase [Alpinimonas psychrophila]|uniref:Xylulokinase n=1 Tax=Alpinimonas psychrophila TaxID=748908 RepID=A0A7W3JS73_9MICO|nr:FGGY family carbohydrate kinase [Alpinimonas psychrophila]MBA8828279.1 xylulokinase [Alpinimonas psychrophila]
MSSRGIVIAGLDFGTSSVKLVVVTSDGAVLFRAQQSYPTFVGDNGEVEQDPEDWWEAAKAVMSKCPLASEIAAIGLTGQMQNLILVDHKSAIRPALLYSDTRARVQHDRVHAALPNWERETLNVQDVTNVAAKFAWLLDNEKNSIARAESAFFSASGYVAWRAGGMAACDLTTASTTGLLDVGNQDWLRSVLEEVGINRKLLPDIVGLVPNDNILGVVSGKAAAELGVTTGIPIVLAPGDAASTTDGLIGSSPGDAYLYLGTTGWLAAVTETIPTAPSPIHTLAMPGWESWLRIGAVQSAGSAAAWARDIFLPGLDFHSVEARIAPRVREMHARPLCLPGISGERTPIRDGAFRGAFVGIHKLTDGVDFYLAVLTGIAMGLRHAADDMGIGQNRIPLVGGAATSEAWRCILADVFDATIVTHSATDPGSWSAARSAANALGVQNNLHPFFTPTTTDVKTTPAANRSNYDPLIAVHRPLYDALAPTFHQLA